ncbi:flagellar biosynthetic protein FliO [Erythrobacter sp. YJ-T3-07]|uniref:flagellar biosynthetic protein FliO n=1 Tax=Erythrobacter sp. YJ-T3-07 TaxID=2793063 RepID=UPI0018D42FF1|nr:flagellar biosynthetic protein FliO [Erythrobacter sp. YJ-T3-07]MBH1943187.1 flagellar biosynthetic protein FliO [Erythrobacter sp. YJ-T3-07]
MLIYILKLLILLPLIGGMIWGSLKLAKRMQGQLGAPGGGGEKAVRIIETTMLSPTLRLAVIEFHGREILVSTSKGGLTRLAEAPARAKTPDTASDIGTTTIAQEHAA